MSRHESHDEERPRLESEGGGENGGSEREREQQRGGRRRSSAEVVPDEGGKNPLKESIQSARRHGLSSL